MVVRLSDFAAEQQRSFNNLSIADLLEAREQYHVFLTKHPNVIATAIGRYLIRKKGVVPKNGKGPKPPRTLANSEVVDNMSWPCVLVFVDQWQDPAELTAANELSALVPKTLYLADGRAVPVCLVEAARKEVTSDIETAKAIRYPTSLVGGGFPLIVNVQGRQHVATVGCLMTDGSRYYGPTSRHVAGEPGRTVYARLGGSLREVGSAASERLQLTKIAFAEAYPGLPGAHLSINADVGLIDLIDANQWRTDVYGVGPLQPMVDVSGGNMTLGLIARKVRGFGAGSGPIEGQISALFYRYRTIGGMEYVADFLIGPTGDHHEVVRHGDSGAVLLLECNDVFRPFAINWGAHEFSSDGDRDTLGFALATGLPNVCRLLDVDIVRGWNIDQPYTWGKTGHFKIGFRAADLVRTEKLKLLLKNNQASLGYSNEDLKSEDIVSGKFTHDFVPLADVADIIWRTTRPDDESNHFCDIDESDPHVFGGKNAAGAERGESGQYRRRRLARFRSADGQAASELQKGRRRKDEVAAA